MQTLSSASRTCIESASAVECTATVAMPMSRQARAIRNAISPRLAIRILRNTDSALRPRGGASIDDHEYLAVLHRMAVGHQDLAHGAGARRGYLVRPEEHTSEL